MIDITDLQHYARTVKDELAESLTRIAIVAIDKAGVHIPWDSTCAKEIEDAISSYLAVAS